MYLKGLHSRGRVIMSTKNVGYIPENNTNDHYIF